MGVFTIVDILDYCIIAFVFFFFNLIAVNIKRGKGHEDRSEKTEIKI